MLELAYMPVNVYGAVTNTHKAEAHEYLHQVTALHLGDTAAPPWFAGAIASVMASLNILRDEVKDLRNSFKGMEVNMARS